MRVPTTGPFMATSPYKKTDKHGLSSLANAEMAAGREKDQALPMLGESMVRAGSAMADITARIKDQQNLNWVNKKFLLGHTKLNDRLGEFETDLDGEKSMDQATQFGETLTKDVGDLLLDAPSQEAKDAATLKLQALAQDVQQRAGKMAHKAFRDYSLGQLDDSLNGFRTSAYRAQSAQDVVGLADMANAQINSQVQSGLWLSPSDGKKLVKATNEDIWAMFLKGQTDDDSRAPQAIQDFEAGRYDDKLHEKQFLSAVGWVKSAKSRLEQKAKEEQRQYKEAMTDHVEDIIDKVNNSVESAFDTGTFSPAMESYLADLGKLEGAGLGRHVNRVIDKAFTITARATRYGAFLHQSQFMPFDQRRELLKDLEPTPGSANYSETKKVYQAAVEYTFKQEKAFNDDPAGYVQAEAVRRVAAMGRDPTKEPSLVLQKSLDLQKSLGADTVRVLPRKQAEDLHGRFMASTPEGKISMLDDIDQAFGEHKQQVLAELDVGSAAQLAQVVHDSARAGHNMKGFDDSRVLVETLGIKESEIPIDKGAKKDVEGTLEADLGSNSVWKAMSGVLHYQPFNTAYAKHLGQIQEGVRKMALLTGDAGRALNMLDNSFEAIADDDLAFVYYPKGSLGPKVSAGVVSDRLETLRQKVGDVLEWQRGLVPEKEFAEKVRDLQSRGVWVNSSDGRGVVLLDPTTGKAITTKSGSPWIVPWEGVANPGVDPSKASQLDLGMRELLSRDSTKQLAVAPSEYRENAWDQFAAREGTPYLWGGKDSSKGGIDCSGFVSEVNRNAFRGTALADKVNRIFDPGTMNAQSQITALAKATGGGVREDAISFDTLAEGDVIATSKSDGRHWDHITEVLIDPGSGTKYVVESRGKRGVIKTPARSWLEEQQSKGRAMLKANVLDLTEEA